MGYAKRLQSKFDVTQELIKQREFSLLAKRRDKVNPAGVHIKKESAEFRTSVGGKTKVKGKSKQPQGWYKAGPFA